MYTYTYIYKLKIEINKLIVHYSNLDTFLLLKFILKFLLNLFGYFYFKFGLKFILTRIYIIPYFYHHYYFYLCLLLLLLSDLGVNTRFIILVIILHVL